MTAGWAGTQGDAVLDATVDEHSGSDLYSWPRESGETQVLPGAAGHQCWPPPVPSSTNWDMGHNSE